jgi:hypothetical protein
MSTWNIGILGYLTERRGTVAGSFGEHSTEAIDETYLQGIGEAAPLIGTAAVSSK